MARTPDVAFVTFQVPREQAVDLAIQAGREKLAEILGVDVDVADDIWADGHEREHLIQGTIRSGYGQDPERNPRDGASSKNQEAKEAGWAAVRAVTNSLEASFYGTDKRRWKDERDRLRNIKFFIGDVFERNADKMIEAREAAPTLSM